MCVCVRWWWWGEKYKEKPWGNYPTLITTPPPSPLAFPDHTKAYAALREHIKALTPRKAVKTLKAKLHICLLRRRKPTASCFSARQDVQTFHPSVSDQNWRHDGGRAAAHPTRRRRHAAVTQVQSNQEAASHAALVSIVPPTWPITLTRFPSRIHLCALWVSAQ